MLNALFWMVIGFVIGVNLTLVESRASLAWDWLKTKAKSIGLGFGRDKS